MRHTFDNIFRTVHFRDHFCLCNWAISGRRIFAFFLPVCVPNKTSHYDQNADNKTNKGYDYQGRIRNHSWKFYFHINSIFLSFQVSLKNMNAKLCIGERTMTGIALTIVETFEAEVEWKSCAKLLLYATRKESFLYKVL